jgi:hypothetical protein
MAGLVRLQEDGNPVIWLERSPKEPQWRFAIDRAHGLDLAYCFVSTSCPANTAASQSVPVKSASIRVACAVPTLPKVPLHPRGEAKVPCVLICVGGVLLGEIAVVAVVIIFSQACSERMVLLKD